MTTTTPRMSFFQTRSAAVTPVSRPVVTRAAAQPGTPRPSLIKAPSPSSAHIHAIVLAWDNVLFPTKWMVDCVGLLASSNNNTNKQALEETKRACLNNPFIVQALTAIEQQVLQLLGNAITKAPVYILTDQTAPVVESICGMFFPQLKASLARANGRVRILSAPSPSSSPSVSARAAWKVNALQQIASESLVQQRTRAAAGGSASAFKILAVSADEVDVRAAAHVHELVARVGVVQCMSLANNNGKPLSLVDFHKQLQSVAAALAAQTQ